MLRQMALMQRANAAAAAAAIQQQRDRNRNWELGENQDQQTIKLEPLPSFKNQDNQMREHESSRGYPHNIREGK